MNKALKLSALALLLVAGTAAAGMAIVEPPPGEKKPAEKTPAAEKQKKAPMVPVTKPSADPSKEEKAKVEPTLKVGDAAPSLKVDGWIKGEEVKSLESGKVYVVEFWATWCGPCVKVFPHLSKLQKDHPELTVIGVASSERLPKQGQPDNRLQALKDFVSKQGENMAYRVAFDSDREMSAEWMQAAGQRGIPCAFVVGHDGKLAYIGHPSSMDSAVSKALKASADAKKTALAK